MYGCWPGEKRSERSIQRFALVSGESGKEYKVSRLAEIVLIGLWTSKRAYERPGNLDDMGEPVCANGLAGIRTWPVAGKGC